MTIILFDVDGTLVPSGEIIRQDMIETIEKLKSALNVESVIGSTCDLSDKVELGIVGGGAIDKIRYQLGEALKYFKYIFAECGAIAYVDNVLIHERNMIDYCDRILLNKLIGKAMSSISKMPILFNGHQIDFRKGLIYISPPGMQATFYERNYFLEKDKLLHLRKNLLAELKSLDPDNHFDITLGGAVGIAIHPKGWDKSQVVKYFNQNSIPDQLYYFGDRTEPDGNDYPIYSHKSVKGVSVSNYKDTIIKINEMLKKN